MSFIETPRFPLYASIGAVGGPEYRTDIVTVNSGFEQRNVGWAQARAKYQIEFPLVNEDKETLIAWFRSVRGAAHGFRMRDWVDYACTTSNGRLGLSANGTGASVYQLYKYYSAGTLDEYRKIRKPVSGSVAIYRAGVLQTAGASAGNYAIDTTTGLVTFVADAFSLASSVVVGATTNVILAAQLGLIAGDSIYLSGFTGADADALNSLAHTISLVTLVGGSPSPTLYQFTLTTNTAGLTITLGSGRGSSFVQADESLSWAGEFDVPVRFEGDYAALNAESPRVYRGQNMNVIEIRT